MRLAASKLYVNPAVVSAVDGSVTPANDTTAEPPSSTGPELVRAAAGS